MIVVFHDHTHLLFLKQLYNGRQYISFRNLQTTSGISILFHVIISGGGCSDIFNIRRLRPFLGFKILNFNIFCYFHKNNIF